MIVLAFVLSEYETISGIPETVEITASQPATIYYTLDGTLPDGYSTPYTGPIRMPTDSGTVILSAVAYYIVDSVLVPSGVISEVFSTDISDITRAKYVFFDGISYPGGLDIPFYFDAAGDPVFFLDIPPEDLDFILSDRDRDGTFVGTDNQVGALMPSETGSTIDDPTPLFSSANNQLEFRSDAKYIKIDGRASAEQPLSVRIINGPHMSLRNSRTSWGGIDYINFGNSNHKSGSLTRYFYNRDKKVIVFSYFDTTIGKWVNSIQDLPDPVEPPPRPITQTPFVVKWLPYGKHQA